MRSFEGSNSAEIVSAETITLSQDSYCYAKINPFASEAAEYAHLRPTYPEYLFEFLATIVASRNIAWDCATGNGQAATHLARHFGQVMATDESGEMIAQAPRDPRIT
jgi:hypothetical protein